MRSIIASSLIALSFTVAAPAIAKSVGREN